MAAVTTVSDLELKKIKSVTASTFTPSNCHEVMGPDAMILVFLMLSFMPAFSFSFSCSHIFLSPFFLSSSSSMYKSNTCFLKKKKPTIQKSECACDSSFHLESHTYSMSFAK